MKTDAESVGRFVYMTEFDLSIDNGPGINEREFVKAVLTNHEAEVVCVAPKPALPDNFHDDRIVYVPAHGGRGWGYLFHLLGSYRVLRRICRNENIIGLGFRLGGTPILPFAMRVTTRLPILLKTLGLYQIFGEESVRTRLKNGISRVLFPIYESVIRSARIADVESQAYVTWTHSKFGIDIPRVRVIPNGVNVRRFSIVPRQEARAKLGLEGYDSIVGYVGAISAIRRLDRLIEAFAAVEGRGRTGLVLVGGGTGEPELRALAARLGVADRVVFAGSVAYGDVPLWMNAFDVAVDPTAVRMRVGSVEHIASYSQKIAQYLSCGTPVVAWTCADTRFLDELNVGRTAAYPDVSGLVTALEDLLLHTDQEREEAIKRARSHVMLRLDSFVLARQRLEMWRTALHAQGTRDGASS